MKTLEIVILTYLLLNIAIIFQMGGRIMRLHKSFEALFIWNFITFTFVFIYYGVHLIIGIEL